MVAGEEYPADHAARIDHALPRLDALRLPGVEDHGLEERPVGAADDAGHHRGQARIGYGVEQELVALDARVEHHGGVLPLPQSRILFLEPQILLVDLEDLADRTEPAVEPAQGRLHDVERRRGPVGDIGASAVEQVRLRLADQDQSNRERGEQRDRELCSSPASRNLPPAVRHNPFRPLAGLH